MVRSKLICPLHNRLNLYPKHYTQMRPSSLASSAMWAFPWYRCCAYPQYSLTLEAQFLRIQLTLSPALTGFFWNSCDWLGVHAKHYLLQRCKCAERARAGYSCDATRLYQNSNLLDDISRPSLVSLSGIFLLRRVDKSLTDVICRNAQIARPSDRRSGLTRRGRTFRQRLGLFQPVFIPGCLICYRTIQPQKVFRNMDAFSKMTALLSAQFCLFSLQSVAAKEVPLGVMLRAGTLSPHIGAMLLCSLRRN